MGLAKEAADEVFALSEREAARRLSISPATLRFWRSKGRGPRVARLGRRAVYRPSDLLRFLDQSLDPDIDPDLRV